MTISQALGTCRPLCRCRWLVSKRWQRDNGRETRRKKGMERERHRERQRKNRNRSQIYWNPMLCLPLPSADKHRCLISKLNIAGLLYAELSEQTAEGRKGGGTFSSGPRLALSLSCFVSLSAWLSLSASLYVPLHFSTELGTCIVRTMCCFLSAENRFWSIADGFCVAFPLCAAFCFLFVSIEMESGMMILPYSRLLAGVGTHEACVPIGPLAAPFQPL